MTDKFHKMLVLLLAVILTGLTSILSLSEPVQAHSSLTIDGRGWGHGRGMSQYGALGYARAGWSSNKILNHYYSNTVSGNVPSNAKVNPSAVKVNLLHASGEYTKVDLESGSIDLKDQNGSHLKSYSGKALRIVPKGTGYIIQTSSSCSGPWIDDTSFSNKSSIQIHERSSTSGKDGLLKVCSTYRSVWYAGYVIATKNTYGYPRTVNVVNVEQYLRGVVPNESPAYWDMAALESQAVAARSYVLAGDSRYLPYANTCDTARCQVYDGLYTTRGGLRSAYNTRTDQAIKNTNNIVRIKNSAVARTEFSSSSGGYTAGGEFPAVRDAGDSISSNPNHTWSAQVDPGILDKYGYGHVVDIVVTKRNGLGADGGRVLEAQYKFNNKTLTVSGDQVRLDFGLKSNWFTLKGKSTSNNVDLSNDAYIHNIFLAFRNRKANSAELSRWRTVVKEMGRRNAAFELAKGEAFSGTMIDSLYVNALGRRSDKAGRLYWLNQMRSGLSLPSVGEYFYSSGEYWKISGSNNDGFITNLYKDVLDRMPDNGGKSYWVDLLDRKTISRKDAVDYFYSAKEARVKRSSLVYQKVTKKQLNPELAQKLAYRLSNIDEIKLSAEIASEHL